MGSAAYFPVQALDGVLRDAAPPMLAQHLAVRQRFGVESESAPFSLTGPMPPACGPSNWLSWICYAILDRYMRD